MTADGCKLRVRMGGVGGGARSRLTVDLQMSFESGASSGILGFAFVSSRVLQLNVGDFQHRLGLAQPRLFRDVAIYLPPCDCWHRTVTTEERD